MKASFLVCLTFLCALTGSAAAQPLKEIDGWIAEVSKAKARLVDAYDLQPAKARIRAAFQAAGIGYAMRFADSAGNGLYGGWHAAQFAYRDGAYKLSQWRHAVERGEINGLRATVILRPRMAAFRRMDTAVHRLLQERVREHVAGARFYDAADAVGCCDDPYDSLLKAGRAALSATVSRQLNRIRMLEPIPDVPKPGAADPPATRIRTLEELRAILDNPATDRAERRGALGEMILLLETLGDETLAPEAEALRILAERMDFRSKDVSALLAEAHSQAGQAAEGELLGMIRDGMLDRATHLVPLVMAAADDPKKVIEKVTNLARHVVELADDSKDPVGATSARLRFATMLAALAKTPQFVSELQAGNADATRLVGLVNDFGTISGLTLSTTAPFAGPLGAIGGLLQNDAEALAAITESLDGVADVIAGNYDRGYEKALAGARRTERLLSPEAFGDRMARGAADGTLGNIPFLRAIKDYVLQ